MQTSFEKEKGSLYNGVRTENSVQQQYPVEIEKLLSEMRSLFLKKRFTESYEQSQSFKDGYEEGYGKCVKDIQFLFERNNAPINYSGDSTVIKTQLQKLVSDWKESDRTAENHHESAENHPDIEWKLGRGTAISDIIKITKQHVNDLIKQYW